jgi:hypothetical protein
MADQRPKRLSEMMIGEKGFCSKDAVYVGERLSTFGPTIGQPEPRHGFPGTSTFLRPNLPVYHEPSDRANIPVERHDMGFIVQWTNDISIQADEHGAIQPLLVISIVPPQSQA